MQEKKTSPAARRRWVLPSSAYDQRSAMWFLAPMMLVLSVVAVFPVIYSFWISLHDLKLTRPHRVPFVWFDNYVKVFSDPLFWESVARTASFTVMSVLAVMVIATAIALLLNEDFRGRRVLSAILLIPWAIPYVANGLMWKWIYDSGYGALNGLLMQLGFIDKYIVMLGDADKTMADHQCLRLERSAAGDHPDPGHAQIDTSGSLQRGQGGRRTDAPAFSAHHAAPTGARLCPGDDLRIDDGDSPL